NLTATHGLRELHFKAMVRSDEWIAVPAIRVLTQNPTPHLTKNTEAPPPDGAGPGNQTAAPLCERAEAVRDLEA
ncbi:hypothetical protein, partial [Streptomyces sp. NPDC017673]|uniref:hypothetical protein n=1 Tax=unclassified Streptomyces TaxID=2593676 RepID=UPI0037A8FCAF